MGGGIGSTRPRMGGGGSGGASGGEGGGGGAGSGDEAAPILASLNFWITAPATSPIFESGNFISPMSNPAPDAKSPTIPPKVGRRMAPEAAAGRARTS